MEKLTKIMWNQKPKFTERSRTVLGKRQSWLFMSMALLFGHASLVSSQTLSSGASGNWTAIATWLTSGTGTITTVSNNATVNGSGSNFSASMIGMGLYNASNVRIGTRTVSSVASATSLTLSGTAGANNNNIAYKYGAVPGNFTVNINHDVVVNQSLAINSPGSYTVNGTLIDAAGGTAYSLTLDGQNATNRGTFTVNGNTTFGGALTVNNNGHLIINSGDTLRVGGTTFTNNCYVTIHEGGVLIVNGNLTNEVNSTNIEVNGSIIVLGNVINKNQGDVYGAGSVTATGTISNGTGSKVFGSSDNCSSGPCSSSGGTTCSYTSSVSG
ncbi:MAG TPA: hypothetical protein VL947_01670, partial [Cytophagales bacterium]|nr:hypothetical protein [Cytophagales bacterium]